VFLLERSTIIDRSVLIRLEIDGTATMGADYESFTPFLNLAAGETTSLITVTPKPGSTLQFGAESIRLTVAEHASYRVDPPRHAEVIIVDSQSTLADWRASHFPELANLSDQEFAAHQSDQSGIPPFLSYAFGLPDAGTRPAVRLVDGHLAIEFTRFLAASDLRWVVESSPDLRTWTADPALLEDVSSSLHSNDARRTLYRLTEPAASGPATFLRVRVDYQP
jgi:hypothetical protein